MATREEAIAEGFACPQDTDLVASGDDAITQNARRSVDLINGGRWWKRSILKASENNLDNVQLVGAYQMEGAATASKLGIPVPSTCPGWVEVTSGYNTSYMIQIFHSYDGQNDFIRYMWGGVWQPWQGYGWSKVLLPTGTDQTTVLTPGAYSVAWYNAPKDPAFPGESYSLEVLRSGDTWTLQRATNSAGLVRTRTRGGGVWSSWKSTTGNGTGLQARMSVETTGEWTTLAELDAYLSELDTHPDAEMLTIGRSVQGKDIRALRIGRKDAPAFLAIGGQHGNEPGNTHALMLWARQLLEARDTRLMDMCVLIVPLVNPDNWLNIRGNANGVDLNRDWIDFTQPETQAVRSLIQAHNVLGSVDGHSFGYPREVSLRSPELGTQAVRDKADQLYAAIARAVVNDGQFTRQYEPENRVGMHHEGMAVLGIPAVFTEIPSSSGEAIRPNRYWQARSGALAMDAACRQVWAWTPTYPTDLVATNKPHGGLRDVTALMSTKPSAGRVLFRREGSICRLSFDQVKFATATSNTILTLPVGYRPRFTDAAPVSGLSKHAQVTVYGNVQIYAAAADALIVGSMTWNTDETPPQAALGTPAA